MVRRPLPDPSNLHDGQASFRGWCPRLRVAATLLTYTVAATASGGSGNGAPAAAPSTSAVTAPSSKTTNVTSTLPPPPNTPPRITTNQFDTLWQRTRDTHFARLKAR